MLKKSVLILYVVFTVAFVKGQPVKLVPPSPSALDTVTLFYNAALGNGALKDYNGDIFLHTGLITAKSLDGHDWKNVVGNWGKPDKRVMMKKEAENLYSFKFVIKDLYNLLPGTKVQRLAFVFRNADGSLVGKDKNNNDFLIPVFGYKPPVKKKPVYIFEKRKLLSYDLYGNELTVRTDHGTVKITAYGDKIVEVKNLGLNDIGKKDSSVAVILKPETDYFPVVEDRNWLKWKTGNLGILVHKNPVYTVFIYNNDTLLAEKYGYFERTDNPGLKFKISGNEHFYGLGERAVDTLRGHRFQLFNRPQYGYEKGALNLNFSVPLVLSSKRYLLFFDNFEKGYVDLGMKNKNIMEWGAIGGIMKYFFIAGDDFNDIYAQYAKLTGTQPLPPLWALGNLQSRMGYRTQKEADSIVKLMKSANFPLDAIILDFYWFGDSIKGTMGRLDWYKPNWPHPDKMIESFKKSGVKTVLITEPYILDTLKNFATGDSLGIFAVDSTGKTYINREFYFGNGALIDIFKPVARQWFWRQYQKEIKIGVAGWWGDLGEPESHPADLYHINGKAFEVHNIYAHIWNKMLYDNYRKYYPGTRLFNLNRAGYAGSQRYSVFPWTGDVSRSWKGLQAQLPLMINMSLSGLPFIHSDAGGFAQGIKDDELYTRWLQMACFSPVLRPHGSGIPSEPVFFNDTTQKTVRDFMKLRYSLLPYLYTASWKAHRDGKPLLRPLFFDFPSDTNTFAITGEYMWGDDFLVYPVVKQGQKQALIYLPPGVWYDWWTNSAFTGGKYVTVKLTMDKIPLFVKAGAFITMVKPVENTGLYSTEQLKVMFYALPKANEAMGVVYDDDGKTAGNFENGNFELLEYYTSDGKHFTVSSVGNYDNAPKRRKIVFEFIENNRVKRKRFILKNGKPVKFFIR